MEHGQRHSIVKKPSNNEIRQLNAAALKRRGHDTEEMINVFHDILNYRDDHIIITIIPHLKTHIRLLVFYQLFNL